MQKFYIKEKSGTTALTSPQKVYEEFKTLSKADQESFWIIGLNTANKIIVKECIFLGGINCSTIDVKLIFRRLLQAGCNSFLCLHNHPGGQLTPSKEDITVTRKIKETGQIISLPLLDHIIISSEGFYSFRESNNL
jgi:DNA repair protein RadC